MKFGSSKATINAILYTDKDFANSEELIVVNNCNLYTRMIDHLVDCVETRNRDRSFPGVEDVVANQAIVNYPALEGGASIESTAASRTGNADRRFLSRLICGFPCIEFLIGVPLPPFIPTLRAGNFPIKLNSWDEGLSKEALDSILQRIRC
jgi:hypothetical protein